MNKSISRPSVLGRLAGLILGCVLTLAVPFSSTAKGVDLPDFAFPETVAADATKRLDAALRSGNGEATIRAIIDLGLAKAAVSTESLPSLISRIEQTAAASTDPATRSLLQLLEANIYAEILQSNRWTYARRESTGANATDDFTLWSKADFQAKITALADSALTAAKKLQRIPLQKYSEVIDFERGSLRFFPTLYDFAAYRAIELLDLFDRSDSQIPPIAMRETGAVEAPLASPTTQHILRIYNDLVAFHTERNDAPALVMSILQRTRFVHRHTFDLDEDDNSTLFDIYFALYSDFAYTDAAIEFLLDIPNFHLTTKQEKILYKAFTDFAKARKSYFRINAVLNMIAELEHSAAHVFIPSLVGKGSDFDISVNVRNIHHLRIVVYSLPPRLVGPNETEFNPKNGSLGHPLDTLEVNFEGNVPFRAGTTIPYRLTEYGRYIFVPIGDNEKGSGYYPIVRCSDLSLVTTEFADRTIAWAINPVDGRPVEGASMRLYQWRDPYRFTTVPGTSAADGQLTVSGFDSGQLQAVKGDDTASPTAQFSKGGGSPQPRINVANVLTDLALYHVGDTVGWTAVAYDLDKGRRHLLEHKQLSLRLMSPNYTLVDSISFVTDDWGRASGRMALPTASLTGNFQLYVYEGNRQIGSCSVMVSDYKLPTFQVTIDEIQFPATNDERGETGDERPATVSGTVATFAGFPLADADVTLTLTNNGGWWIWWEAPQPIAKLHGVTDADGLFQIVIPAELIAASPWPKGYFAVSVSATSITGETQQAESGFNMGKPLTINISIPTNFEVGKSKAHVETLNREIVPVATPLAYRFENVNTGAMIDGTVESGNVTGMMSKIPSGTYTGKFWTRDPQLADTAAIFNHVIIYRPTDTHSPVDSLLWVPDNFLTADSAGRASIVYATSHPDASILYLLADEYNHLIHSEWLTPGAGLHHVDVQFPEGTEHAEAHFFVMKNMERLSHKVEIESLESQKQMAIKFETFRDKATPGSVETLTLRTQYADGTPALSAMMLDISNKAIDMLAPNPFSLKFRSSFYPTMMSHWSSIGDAYMSISSSQRSLDVPEIVLPQWQTYGQSFFPTNNFVMHKYLSSSRPMMAAGAMVSDDMEQEVAFDEVMDKSPLGNYEPKEEEVDDSKPQTTSETYRPSEIPLAYFAPMLTSDAEGRVSVSYRLPDANTTWLLRTAAFDRGLICANAERSIVASKPLMVSLNAPRFVRTADHLTLQAMAMNATDSLLSVGAKIEVIDPADGRVLAATDTILSLEPRGSAAFGVAFDVPFDVPMALVRARADGALFADGEQTLLPVLASEQTVMESDIFYIAPDQSRFTMPLKAAREGDTAYLQFTENPTWEVVSALPGLRRQSIKSSVNAASAIFSACVASGIARSYPETERFLRRMLAEDPKSALEQNADLKALLLDATPWMAQALNDTQRLQRLALILDRREIDKCLAENIHTLAKTQTADGGWAWTSDYPTTSTWATINVLSDLGRLNELGYLPSNRTLNDMIAKALAYIDTQASSDFSKNPSNDFTRYVLVRGYFPDAKMSTASRRVVNATIQRLIADWANRSLTEKAVAAIILNRNGYTATAQQIVESLRQYASKSEQRGMWWQQLDNVAWWSMGKVGATALILDAFAAVGAPDVDLIRQWLILQKTTTDWGSSANTTNVIASILTTGRKWTVNSRGTAIRVGSHLVGESATEKATGMVHTDITPYLQAPTTLTIDRQADYPSYGAVILTGIRDMAEIEARPCEGLSVEKMLTVSDGERWSEEATPSVGDRVRVVLTLKVGRDLDYVTIVDERPAGLEPIEQLPAPVYAEGLCFYRENLDSSTALFIDHLPVGTYVLTYDLWASQAGTFTSGAATVQSQYNPVFTAHSSAQILRIE